MKSISYTHYLDRSLDALAAARSTVFEERLEAAVACCVGACLAQMPILACGNGGSAADCEHIVAELVGRFAQERRAVNAISLTSHGATLTAWANDIGFETVFARQVQAFGREGAVLLALSTSGASENVVKAATTAQALGMSVIAFTGSAPGGALERAADIVLAAPSSETSIIQQVHECWYHYLCLQIESAVAKDGILD